MHKWKLNVAKTILVEEELTLSEYVGIRLKQIKEEKNLTFIQIAEKGGLVNQTICHRVIQGKHSIGIDTLLKLCIGLDCKSSDLLPF